MTVQELIEILQDYPQDAQVTTDVLVYDVLKRREPIVDYDEDNNTVEII